MKTYFDFNLTGKKLLPYWLLVLIFLVSPYIAFIFSLRNIQPGETPSVLIIPLFILLILIAFVISFFIIKLNIENLVFNEKHVEFGGYFGKFIDIMILGVFLTIITIGIYGAWFYRDLHRFFINNSSYNSQNFQFNGSAKKLFVIILLSIIIPLMILVIILTTLILKNPEQATSYMRFQQLVTIIITIPYMYLLDKWRVNIDYKNYHISWNTNFWKSCGKIFVEIVLSILTIGIYMPVALVRLYKYFSERTVANSPEKKLQFGYDIDQLNDFLFIWGQILLTIITIGIYYPWAFCKIGKRIISKTYLEEV
ncbi:MAG TPA: DUF898 family protein [Bacteroidales bacterium]